MKLFIISNRLPLKAQRTDTNEFKFIRSEGGLATGLGSLDMNIEKHWIGWPGVHAENEEEKKIITTHLEKFHFHPVFLTPDQIEKFYEGYSNSTLWPLCHYFYSYMHYETSFWDTYILVNELFAQAAFPLIEQGDMVWVQDYHLMLLPQLLRNSINKVSIGYFHHIPFPSYELFRVLPERANLLNGLLGADLIAFHTHDYMRHFVSATERVLDIRFKLDQVQLGNRTVHVDAFPMGINYQKYNDAILYPEVQQKATELKNMFGNHKLILSVDRLDYSKGILHRIKGFSLFLDKHPEFKGKISLAMIIVPSRDNVQSYADLKTKIDNMIGSINGKFSTINWTPVYYFYHSFDFNELVAMYHIADVALVTPLRDGMNLVAKEYLAAKRDKPGVLILSEMAGAAIELTESIIVNPNDVEQIEKAIFDALEMPKKKQLYNLHVMQKKIAHQTVKKWASDFVNELENIHNQNKFFNKKRIKERITAEIRESYFNTHKRLFILDYDGTLAPYKNNPEDAVPGTELLHTLQKLSSDPANHIVISSGRDHNTLDNWFGQLPLSLAAEHGAFYKQDGRWHENLHKVSWDNEIMHILQQFVDKTPHSNIEIKETALVWHFRNVDGWLASLREQQLINALITPCARLNLQIMQGYKIVEIKSPFYTKGSEVRRILQYDHSYDFMLAMGDDITDDDTFRELPPEAFTIKVGAISKVARYCLCTQSEAIPFLKNISSPSGPEKS